MVNRCYGEVGNNLSTTRRGKDWFFGLGLGYAARGRPDIPDFRLQVTGETNRAHGAGADFYQHGVSQNLNLEPVLARHPLSGLH